MLRINENDPDMEMVGFDIGGGEMYHYKKEPFTGIVVSLYEKTGSVEERQCVDGYMEGAQREYYKNGTLMHESFIKRNSPYGQTREWDEHGNLVHDGDFGPEAQTILAIDVHYREHIAKAVSVFCDLDAEKPQFVQVEYLHDVPDYIPGEFYKRELPCVLALLKKRNLTVVDKFIIDGYVYIDNNKKLGLGGLLWGELKTKKPVIGVAKTLFVGNSDTVKEVFRGDSKNPLYVSAIGMDLDEAAELIKNMKGEFRIPTILKILDGLTKEE